MSRTAAFFDFDRTLIRVNSGPLWVRAERRAGRVSTWELLLAVTYFVRYHLSMIDMDEAMKRALSTVAGQSEADLAERTRRWYADEVRQHLLPAAVEAVERHRAQGHLLVLLTTSSPYLGAAVRDDLRLDDMGCTAFEVDERGRFTGGVVEPTCYGAGKIVHAERIAARHDVDLDSSFFYTDSYTDRPMLERVGHPRVVNPDPRLRRLARDRSWPVLDWTAAPAEGEEE